VASGLLMIIVNITMSAHLYAAKTISVSLLKAAIYHAKRIANVKILSIGVLQTTKLKRENLVA